MYNATSLKPDGAKHDDELKYPQQLPSALQQSQYTLQQSPQQLHQPLQHPQTFSFQLLQQPYQRQQSQPQQPQFQQGLYFQRHQPVLPSLLSQQHQQQQSGPLYPQDQPPPLSGDPSLPISRPPEEGIDTLSRPQEVQSVTMRKSKSGTDGINEDKICPFCNKQFTLKGSFQRHLETRKGDQWHPVDECNYLKNQLSRRKSTDVSSLGYVGGNVGSMSSLDSTPMGKSNSRKRRASRKSLARSQMSSDLPSGQKEKSKLRRKLRDRRIKAKIITNEWLVNQFTKKPMSDSRQASSPATFCHFVAFYVPVRNWPSLTEMPSSALCDEVLSQLRTMELEDLNTLFIQSMQVYEQLDPTEKKRLWLEEVQNCLNSSISDFTLFDLNNIKSIMDKREQLIFEGICANDNLSAYVDADENPTLGEEEEEEHEEEEVDTNAQPSQQMHNHQLQPPFGYPQQRQSSPPQFNQPPPGPASMQQSQQQQQQQQQQAQHPPPPPSHPSLRSNSLPHNSYLHHLPNIPNNDYNDFNSSHFY
ncbi:hypothetical protein KGF57_000605 [Candida theae]|uniref:C2H2-type domain-containing protein n=1 Tax=Candida theae TaxID=1198502 RepID=A0AAD5BIJ2_9ASCO|nr:uncharacterized protein KGF57_000605 [Candida theae]KAI5966641.1 hypothetical protein KGF57_000605 [Candida theae]